MDNLLRVTAGALGCLIVVAFQLQFLPFFSPLFVDNRTVWPIVYFGCWTAAIITTALLLIFQKPIMLRTLPVLVVCALSAALTFIHPIGPVAKNFLVATGFVACGTVLTLASSPLALLRFSAAATVLNAIICLLDIFFAYGFSNTMGRAAGLSINANAAAALLLLGAASASWAVPHRWRTAFLLITGAAILVTQARSILFAAMIIGGLVAANLIWTRHKNAARRRSLQWIGNSALGLGLIVWIAVAVFSNDRALFSAKIYLGQIGTSLATLEKARNSIAQDVRSKTATTESTARADNQPNAAEPSSATSNSAAKPGTDDVVEEITRRMANDIDINSISARGLLLERAFLSYRKGPMLGQGLDAAHALAPHNMFLLFAVAFGDIGWFVPLAFLALTAWWARGIQQMPLLLATTAVMMTSHDLLSPSLLAPIVFGVAGLIWQRHPLNDAMHTLPALPYIVLAVPPLFALGSLFALSAATFPAVPQLLLFLVFCTTALWSACVWRAQKADVSSL